MNKQRKQREQMWAKDPHCENCGVLTILPQDCPGYHPEQHFKSPDNMATIQHMYSRLDPKRWEPSPAGQAPERRHLLWCYKCNQDDCVMQVANLPIEEKWRRSQHDTRTKFTVLANFLKKLGMKDNVDNNILKKNYNDTEIQSVG